MDVADGESTCRRASASAGLAWYCLRPRSTLRADIALSSVSALPQSAAVAASPHVLLSDDLAREPGEEGAQPCTRIQM
jgi:hypothetical protein